MPRRRPWQPKPPPTRFRSSPLAAIPGETGLVTSLARPGGNVTGPSGPVAGVNAKHVELLRGVVPSLTRAAALGESTSPVGRPQWDEFQQAAETAGVQAQLIDLKGGYSTS